MAAVFVVVIPTEAFELKCREKEDAASVSKSKSTASAASRPSSQKAADAAKSTESRGSLRTEASLDLPMKQMLESLLLQLHIFDAVWHPTKDGRFYQVVYTCDSHEKCEDILHTLYHQGIGRLYESTLCVVPCSVYYQASGGDAQMNGRETSDEESDIGETDELNPKKDLRSLRKQFIQSIKARLTVAQVVEGVKAGANLTFDFIMFVILAGLIAALGLVENSPVVVVASMLISPIMGPIMAWTFGIVIKDKQLQKIGIKSELIGLCTCLCTGFVFGLICGPLDKVWGSGQLPTDEMLARGKLRTLWVGMLIALPSGAGVALSILGGNAGSLVGVAISASLLPPCVNAGIMWAYALVIYVRSFTEVNVTHTIDDIELVNRPSLIPDASHEVQYSYDMVHECLLLGLVSSLLTLVNIVCIIFMAILVLKIKEVAPYTSIPTAVRFWKEDIKITRDYNRTLEGGEAKDFRQTFLQEWAAINQIDHTTDPTKTASQLNYLRNAVEEAEGDEVYQTVIRYIGNPSPIDPLQSLCSLSRTTWPHANRPRTSMKKPKVWDIDFNPRQASGRRRMFSDSHERYSQLPTIGENDGEVDGKTVAHKSKSNCVSPNSGDTPVANVSATSSSSHHSTPSRLLRSLLGRRFVVTQVDKPHRKSKKDKQAQNEDCV